MGKVWEGKALEGGGLEFWAERREEDGVCGELLSQQGTSY